MLRILGALVGGAAMWAAHEPLGWWPLAFVSLAVLWLTLYGRSMWRGLWLGGLWALAFFLPHFAWADVAAGTPLAQIALAVIESSYLAVLGAVWAGLTRLRAGSLTLAAQAVAGALTWVGVEQLRSSWPLGGMPWGSLGFALVDSPLVKLAPIGGTALVGGIAVAISILLGSMPRVRPLGVIAAFTVALGMFLAPVVIPTGARPVGSVQLGVVQGNIPPRDAEDRALKVTQNHVAQTEAMLKDAGSAPDMILWPESASDLDIREDSRAGALVFGLQRKTGIPLLLGTQQYVDDGRYNDVLVLDRGEVTARYSKQHPVPFGEYMPLRDFLRQFAESVDLVKVDMLAGGAPALIDTPIGKVAVPICFEVAYEQIIAQAVGGGAQLIVVPTNNATFGRSGLPEQQFAMTRFQAIEHGRSAIQVSTTGITGAVTPKGRVLYKTDLFVGDGRVVKVNLYDGVTFATATAKERVLVVYVGAAVSAMLGVMAGAIAWQRRRAARRAEADWGAESGLPAGAGRRSSSRRPATGRSNRGKTTRS